MSRRSDRRKLADKPSASARLKKILDRHKARAEHKREVSARRRANKAAEDAGEIVTREEPHTVEGNRDLDDDVVDDLNYEEFEEVLEAEADDEFASYFRGETTPKLLMTTIERPKSRMLKFLKELQVVLPESYYVPRTQCELADNLLKFALDRNFTDVMILEARQNQPYGIFVTHLPEGPTTHFRLSGLLLAEEMEAPVHSSTHKPEVIMKNFSTAIARRVQRQLQALFPLDPEFDGRRVVTFINKSDYIFFRHYRYIFKAEGTKAGLAEIGPKFTLKLRSVQEGLLDRECGKYEFHWKPKLQESHLKHYI